MMLQTKILWNESTVELKAQSGEEQSRGLNPMRQTRDCVNEDDAFDLLRQTCRFALHNACRMGAISLVSLFFIFS